MTVTRILCGLDRLPSTLAADDPRLPAIELGATPLRLNSEPLPAAAWDIAQGDGVQGDGAIRDHSARMTAVRAWLLGGCGDYNEALRRGVWRYLDAIAAHVEHHRVALASGLERFHGLYQVEDWTWSALRPLPRAWWQQNGGRRRADLAFWNRNDIIAMDARDFDSGELPAPFQYFWRGEILPVSPFRRTFPSGPDGVSLK